MADWALTAAQHGIWLGQQLDPASPAYNTAEYADITGPVDTGLLAAAIRRAVGEAEALSVRFTDGPRQITDPPDWEVHVADLRDQPDPRAAAERWMAGDVARPVDLTVDTLFAHAIFRIGDERFLWYHRVHHILLDGYGLALIARRVADLYTAVITGAEPPDHGFGTLQSVIDEEVAQDTSAARDFWMQYSRERPAPVTLAGRSGPLAHSVARAGTDLDRPTVDLLRDVAKASRANWTEALIAAIAVYLHRMTGAVQVSVAVPVMLRTGSVALRVPCMVLNVVPVWVDFTGDPSFAEVITAVAGHLRRSRRHHHYRYEQLRRDLALVGSERKLFGPSANIMPFDYGLTFGASPASMRNVSAGLVEDMAFNVYDRADGAGLRIAVDGNPTIYDEEQLRRHAYRLTGLLRNLIADPQEAVGTAPILLGDEREQLLHTWNATGRTWPDTTITELLTQRVSATPDAIALVGVPESLTFAELDHRVEALAGHLAEQGAGPGRVVMHLLPRTVDAVIALFAILRTGAAYLPADPDYPRHRLELLIDDARPALVATVTELASMLPAGTPAVLLDVPVPAGTAPAGPQPADPLCLIYTSGSTGRPKGAVLTHRSMVNLYHHHRTTMIEPEADGRRLRAALSASLSFDTSWEGLLWLLAGHELHFIDDDVRREPAEMVRYLTENRIDFIDITPTYAGELLTAGLLDEGRHRPAVIALGGEATGPALWTALRDADGISAYNLYGPTECTVDTVWARLADSPDPVIGRPVTNTRCYVLDPAMRLLPPGAVGELYLAGTPVAQGYHNRPELTEQRFVPDPFGEPGARLYRTGDLARWRADGLLECLGRADDQVKIRGFRIEPGEIEATLTGHPGIAQAAVVVDPARERLVAYLVTTRTLEPGDVRRYVAERLPDYLVPPVYVFLDRLPVTVSGKLDRAALPEPPRAAADDGRPPSTDRQRILCDLFAAALELPGIGIDDDFFALGGHSLLVARLLVDIRDRFGVKLAIRDIFDAPTVAALDARLDAGAPALVHPWHGIDLAAEVVLDPAFTTAGLPRATSDEVLLTGATGFLGAFLLRELLDRTTARIHCLVRARDEADGQDRLRQSLRRYGLAEAGIERVTAVPGDLARPGLGLEHADFDRLARQIGVVLHNGARVNHLDPYPRLRAANVRGTGEVLRLATTATLKPVHLVSTIDTAVQDETSRVGPDELMSNGYVASKWVAEGLVLEAGRRGLPVSVYRPSRIGGHHRTGAVGTDDALWNLVRAMVTLQMTADADEHHGYTDLVPADVVAAAVVHLMGRGTYGDIYHLTSPEPMPLATVVDNLRRRGYRLATVPAATWEKAVDDAADHSLVLAAMHSQTRAGAGRPVAYRRDHTLRDLAGSGIRFPHTDGQVLDACLDHLAGTGFLPTPPAGEHPR